MFFNEKKKELCVETWKCYMVRISIFFLIIRNTSCHWNYAEWGLSHFYICYVKTGKSRCRAKCWQNNFVFTCTHFIFSWHSGIFVCVQAGRCSDNDQLLRISFCLCHLCFRLPAWCLYSAVHTELLVFTVALWHSYRSICMLKNIMNFFYTDALRLGRLFIIYLQKVNWGMKWQVEHPGFHVQSGTCRPEFFHNTGCFCSPLR